MNNARAFFFGAVCGIAIAAVVALLWPARYARQPWRGYEAAAARGTTAHEFNSSPVARRDVLIALAAVGLIAGTLSYRRVTGPLAAWAGVSAALLLCAFAWPQMRASNLAPLAIIVYPLQALPFLIAAYISTAGRRLLQRGG